MNGKETKVDIPLGGIFLMTILTIIWTAISVFFLDGLYRWTAGFLFAIPIAYLGYEYLKLNKANGNLPKEAIITSPKSEKLYWWIFGLEGFAILIAKNILANINKDELFICSLALIVGLHFIPLAKVFKRKFDYYVGTWTIFVSVIGLFLILTTKVNYKLTNAFVSMACAMSTTLYGLNMISQAKTIIKGGGK